MCLFLNFLSVKWSEKLLKYQLTELGKPSKKLDILWQCANFNCHLPTLPNYDINIYDINTYDKAVIIEAPTYLQVIMTNIKINFSSSSFIFHHFQWKSGHLKLNIIQFRFSTIFQIFYINICLFVMNLNFIEFKVPVYPFFH